jgi:hypothetical protein
MFMLTFARCRDISKSKEKKLPPLDIVHKRQMDWLKVMAILKGPGAFPRWKRRFGPNQKQRPSCKISLPAKASTTRRRANGKDYTQVMTMPLLLLGVLTCR